MKGREIMQKCLKEIIKQISALEQQKEEILSDELQNCVTKYGSNEEIPTTEYNFSAARDEIKAIDKKIRQLRHSLHLANATVIVPEYEMSIGECIILMAQLSKEKSVLTRMARREKKERRQPGYGNAVEWIELNYDKNECRSTLKSIADEVTSLQMAIDRINLTHMAEVDEFN